MKIGHLVLSAVLGLLAAGCGGHPHEHSADGGHPPVEPQVREPVDAVAGSWEELLPNARRPRPGVVSGGQPSAEQLQAAAEAGYRTVINLRMPDEAGQEGEAAHVEELGIDYVSLPIDGAAGITEENARELAALLEAADEPVLLHCGSGNRVGALLALSAFHLEGRSAEDSIQYGLDSGLTRLEPVVRERLGAADSD